MKIKQRKVRGPEGPQVKQTALLASPIYIGQAPGEEEKKIKRGAKIGRWLCFSLSLLDRHALMPQGCIFHYFLKKNWAATRSWNTRPSLQIFVVIRQNQGNYTLPQQIQYLTKIEKLNNIKIWSLYKKNTSIHSVGKTGTIFGKTWNYQSVVKIATCLNLQLYFYRFIL